MKTSKLVIGILSIVLSVFVLFQSCAAGVANSLSENGESSGSAGLLVAICMLVAGIVGIATRNGKSGGAFTAGGFYVVAGLLGVSMSGTLYKDLLVWGIICFIFAAVFIIGTILSNKKQN